MGINAVIGTSENWNGVCVSTSVQNKEENAKGIAMTCKKMKMATGVKLEESRKSRGLKLAMDVYSFHQSQRRCYAH